MSELMSDLVERLISSGLATRETVVGCTPEEVAEIRADHGVDRLPEQYEEFLLLMGRGAGELLRGTDFFYPGIRGLDDDGRELLEENDAAHLLPEGAIVVGMHQGYELYWLAPSGALSWYVEAETEVSRTWPSLADFLAAQIEAQQRLK